MKNWNRFLIAVDKSETSLRAVRYVAYMVAGLADAHICLLHVYPGPPPDFYQQGGMLDRYQMLREERAEHILLESLNILEAAGISGRKISQRVCMVDEGRTISQMVLDIQREGQFGTVATGKRGVSKAEEFLFGSISNALARHSRDFTAWIVG